MIHIHTLQEVTFRMLEFTFLSSFHHLHFYCAVVLQRDPTELSQTRCHYPDARGKKKYINLQSQMTKTHNNLDNYFVHSWMLWLHSMNCMDFPGLFMEITISQNTLGTF